MNEEQAKKFLDELTGCIEFHKEQKDHGDLRFGVMLALVEVRHSFARAVGIKIDEVEKVKVI